MIKRRLVGGILSLVMALLELLLFITYGLEFSAYRQLSDTVFMVRYLVFGIWAIILEVIYIVTCKRRPVKWQEITLEIIPGVLLLFTHSSYVEGLSENTLFIWVVLLQLVFQAVGLPGKNGFKDFPYAVKDQGHDSQEIDKLAKLKELLDSGAITKEEFDQEKKKIWK